MYTLYLPIYLPKNTDVNRKPGIDSAGGHSMLLQYKVMKVTHLMMIKATRGPQ